MSDRQRYHFPDWLRGFAVILMIIFHLAYDLTHFHFLSISFSKDPFWWWFPRWIVFFFFTCVGLSLRMGYLQKESLDLKGFFKRFLELSFYALLITGSTYYLFPNTWIYFGTLHCIALASLLSLPFIGKPWAALVSALIIVSLFAVFYPYTWPKMQHPSMDYIPIFPWLSVVLFGIFLHKMHLHRIPIAQNKLNQAIEYLGKKSLIIYLLHQPILFGLCALAFYYINK